MKICKIIWSTNRLEYLIPTLESSQKFIDWGDHEVDGIFIDDMPTDRDDQLVKGIAESHGYNHVILHKENKGITYTHEEGYDLIQSLEKEYDFIWHQEDDLVISEHIKIDDLITYCNENKDKHQVRLAYQFNWYWPDHPDGQYIHQLPLEEYKNYHIVDSFHFVGNMNFDTSFSLTRANILFDALNAWKEGKLVHVDTLGPAYKKRKHSEATVYHVMSAYTALLKGHKDNRYMHEWATSFYDKNKKAFIEHIGEWSWGQRISPDLFEDKIKELEEHPDRYKDNHGYLFQLSKMREMAQNPSAKINSKTWERL